MELKRSKHIWENQNSKFKKGPIGSFSFDIKKYSTQYECYIFIIFMLLGARAIEALPPSYSTMIMNIRI